MDTAIPHQRGFLWFEAMRYLNEQSGRRGTARAEQDGPNEDRSEHAPMHMDGGHSTTDSDAEMDVLVAQTYRREQAHRFGDHQAELIEHALRAPDAVRRAEFSRMLASHREREEALRTPSDEDQWGV